MADADDTRIPSGPNLIALNDLSAALDDIQGGISALMHLSVSGHLDPTASAALNFVFQGLSRAHDAAFAALQSARPERASA